MSAVHPYIATLTCPECQMRDHRWPTRDGQGRDEFRRRALRTQAEARETLRLAGCRCPFPDLVYACPIHAELMEAL